ncbi:MAG: hypothetical protein P1U56_05865 [Saprospiraceae bacterium]|nr:hypothetical protein [Saprospiraceae bacterium]
MLKENKISKSKNLLVVLFPPDHQPSKELQYLIDNFCGSVIHGLSEDQIIKDKTLYLCGDISMIQSKLPYNAFIIKELSQNYASILNASNSLIALGQVPILIHNAGVYFRQLFDNTDYFKRIEEEHQFQNLTESNKQGKALRKGIYLTDIRRTTTDPKNEILHFRLLRCSSNLTGPTDNYRTTDRTIITKLNEVASLVFEKPTALNHVLAQIYQNKKKEGPNPKETKAKIKAHSDKTKDMLDNGLIAFCTFYNSEQFQHLTPSKKDRFDWCYKEVTGLTRLYFKLKSSVQDASLKKEFSVTLYPNSVFIIPLSTNRLYTHETRPSMLNIDRIPVRMGYVVRSSKTEARYMNGQTYIKENEEWIPLEKMTVDHMTELRHSYYEENKTVEHITYGKVHFSMNEGDYQKPIY